MDGSESPDPKPEINPYAAPLTEELSEGATQLSPPVIWNGPLEERDFLITLQTFSATEKWIYMGLLPLCFGVPAWSLLASIGDGSITPFGWLMIDLGVSLAWLFVLAQFNSQVRQSRERVKAYGRSMHGCHRSAWADETGLMVWDTTSGLRIRWSFFTQGLFFKTHTLLSFRVDAAQRIGIPHRLFVSEDECQRMREYLHEQFGVGGKKNVPNRKQLRKIAFEGQPTAIPDAGVRWDAELWPPEKQPTWHRDVEVSAEPSMARTNRSGSLRALLLLLLPIWSVVVVWLAYERMQTGDWFFLRDDFWINLIFLLPVLLTTVALIRLIWNQHLETEKASQWSTWIRVSDAGIQTRWEDFETWNAWSELGDLILEDERAGWTMGAFPDEIAYSKTTFESEAAFDAFKSALQEGRDAWHESSAA